MSLRICHETIFLFLLYQLSLNFWYSNLGAAIKLCNTKLSYVRRLKREPLFIRTYLLVDKLTDLTYWTYLLFRPTTSILTSFIYRLLRLRSFTDSVRYVCYYEFIREPERVSLPISYFMAYSSYAIHNDHISIKIESK